MYFVVVNIDDVLYMYVCNLPNLIFNMCSAELAFIRNTSRSCKCHLDVTYSVTVYNPFLTKRISPLPSL